MYLSFIILKHPVAKAPSNTAILYLVTITMKEFNLTPSCEKIIHGCSKIEVKFFVGNEIQITSSSEISFQGNRVYKI
jgi:hypothetical protein